LIIHVSDTCINFQRQLDTLNFLRRSARLHGLTLVVGNGLSIDRASHAGIALSPSSPLDWPIPNPTGSGLLIDALPGLKAFVETQRAAGATKDYDVITSIASASKGKAGPWEWSEAGTFDTHSEMRHYLLLAYAWYQLKIDAADLASWQWHKWLRQQRRQLKAVMSYNYDLVLERSSAGA
jgi:hypothetical protein